MRLRDRPSVGWSRRSRSARSARSSRSSRSSRDPARPARTTRALLRACLPPMRYKIGGAKLCVALAAWAAWAGLAAKQGCGRMRVRMLRADAAWPGVLPRFGKAPRTATTTTLPERVRTCIVAGGPQGRMPRFSWQISHDPSKPAAVASDSFPSAWRASCGPRCGGRAAEVASRGRCRLRLAAGLGKEPLPLSTAILYTLSHAWR